MRWQGCHRRQVEPDISVFVKAHERIVMVAAQRVISRIITSQRSTARAGTSPHERANRASANLREAKPKAVSASPTGATGTEAPIRRRCGAGSLKDPRSRDRQPVIGPSFSLRGNVGGRRITTAAIPRTKSIEADAGETTRGPARRKRRCTGKPDQDCEGSKPRSVARAGARARSREENRNRVAEHRP